MIIVPVINALATFGDTLPYALGLAGAVGAAWWLGHRSGYRRRVRQEPGLVQHARRGGIRHARHRRAAADRRFAASLPGSSTETTLMFERIGE